MKSILQNRIEILRAVFAWSLDNGGLTDLQRICLSQERAALMELIEDGNYEDTPKYEIPQSIEEKVQHIHSVILNTKWKKPEEYY